MLPLAPLAVLLLAVSVTAQAGESPWIQDFELARSRALNEKRHLLMVFMAPADDGSDQKLEQEILGKKEFLAAVAKDFVLARFDYPKAAAKVPPPLQQQNAQLRAKYAAPRLPVVWLADSGAQAYARVGYRPGGVEAFVAVLAAKRAACEGAAPELLRAAGLTGVERAKALAEGLRHLDDNIVATVHYREMLEVIQADRDGALGLRDEFDAIAGEGAMLPLLMRLQDEVRPLLADRKWEELDARIATLRERHGEMRWARQYAQFLEGVRKADGDGDPATALPMFAAALELLPRSEVADEIEQHRARAEAAVAKAAEAARKAAEAEAKAKTRKRR